MARADLETGVPRGVECCNAVSPGVYFTSAYTLRASGDVPAGRGGCNCDSYENHGS